MNKKIMIILLCLIPCIINADCSYQDKVDLNKLSSYINYNIDYNKSSKTFTVIFNNVNDNLELKIGNESLITIDNKVTIKNLKEGEKLKVEINSSPRSICVNEKLKIENIIIPYVNKYYNHADCAGHESLPICKSKFINYECDDLNFYELINNDKKPEDIKPNEEQNNEESFINEELINNLTIKFFKIFLMSISSLITFLICNKIYLKVVHNL